MAAQEAANKIGEGTISEQSHQLGCRHGEPLLVAMDALFQYASVMSQSNRGKLADDYVLGPAWLEAAKGVRALLNGDGALAIMYDKTTDSKDNGAIEDLFWAALEIAGFKEEDL